jgi:hypothetical protein
MMHTTDCGQGDVISNVEEYPAFQNLTQFLAAFLFSRFVCPDTLEARNPAK